MTAKVDRKGRDEGDEEGQAGARSRRRFRGLAYGRAARREGADDDPDATDAGGDAPDGGDGLRAGWRRLTARRRPAGADEDDAAGDDEAAEGPDDDEAAEGSRVGGPFRRSGDGKRRSPWRWALSLTMQVLLGLFAAGLAYLAVTFLQVWDASRSNDVRDSDAIVVLGAAQYDCVPSPVLEKRLDHALDLYEEGVAPRIVVTGGKRAGDRCTEAEAGALYLLQHGVPDADILREVKGTNTWESIAASAAFLGDRGYDRVVLVTDDYHALRVRAIADELGLEPVVSPVGDNATLRELVKETGAVAVGRVVGFRRLVDIDDRLVIDPGT